MSKIGGFMLEKDAYVIDYELGEIYAIGELSNELLSRPLSIKERYPFKENGDKVYFQIDKKFYKVLNSEGKALEISEKEYNIMSNITIVPNDSQEIKYIIATIVEDIIQENYGKKISISEEKLAHAKEIITKLNPKIKDLIDIVSKPFIDKLPKVIIIFEFINVIKEIYAELLKENLLIIEGEQFTIDYSSMKIYKGIISIFDSLLEDLSKPEKESYIFKEKNGILYFQIGEKYYKTHTDEKNKKAFEISKFEFEVMVPVISKPKGNFAKEYVILVIIDKILQEKYNKRILLSNLEHTLPMSGLIIRILHNLNPQEKRQVNNIALDMISCLPEQLIRSEYAKNIKDTCLQIFKEYEENIKLLLDSIHEKNKEVFEDIYNSQLKKELINISQKNTIIIDGKEYIIDYVKGEICRYIELIPEGTPGYFPTKGEEYYPFKKIKNELYFQMGKKFYKILNNKDVFEITKEEHDENIKYIIINRNINDFNVVNHYKNYVIAIIIEEIMQDRYNQKRTISDSRVGLINSTLKMLNPKENLGVRHLTKLIMLELPEWIKRDKEKKYIKEAYDKIVQEEKIKLLLDDIYTNNKDYFDTLYKLLREEKHIVKLTLPAGKARPAPPVSTVLGPSGINIHKFCKEFNEWSKDKEGNVELGVIIYDDLSYAILTREEMKHRKNKELSTLLSLRPEAFKRLYDPTEVTSEDDNLEKEINPISIIRQKLETLYIEFGGNPTGGEIIVIEELDCTIGKGRDLHFDQNELKYYAEEVFIHIKGTKEEFPSKSHIQLKGKDMVVLSEIKEDSEEFKYLSNLIKKIDSILEPENKKHPNK